MRVLADFLLLCVSSLQRSERLGTQCARKFGVVGALANRAAFIVGAGFRIDVGIGFGIDIGSGIGGRR